MKRYYNECSVRHYVEKHELKKMIPDIEDYIKNRIHLIEAEKGEFPLTCAGSNSLIFLVSGSVKNCAVTENGKRILLHICEDFEMLRDLELLGASNTDFEIEVINKAVIMEIDLTGIKDILFNDARFLRPMLKQLGMKLAKTTSAQTMVALYDLESRLCRYILQTSVRSKEGKPVFNEKLTETADLLCTSYRHLLRTLKGLCADGILEHRGREYIIINKKALEEKAE